MNMRTVYGTVAVIGLATACDRIPFLGGGANGPTDVARSFWQAAQAGDMELAQTFATGSQSVSLNTPEGGDAGITNVQFGEPIVDGDMAAVPTTLTNTMTSETPSDLSINTSLVRVDGQWKVDLDKTMDEVMRGIMGVSMTDMAQAMGGTGAAAGRDSAERVPDSLARTTPERRAAPAERQAPPPQPARQATAPARQPTPTRQTVAAEVPWTPRAGTVSPGMTPEQVIQAWGPPVSERQYGNWMYMFFRNGCERRCGTFDVVFFQGGQVVDAVVRTPAHTYTGVSSSPPGNVAGFTPPSAAGNFGGNR